MRNNTDPPIMASDVFTPEELAKHAQCILTENVLAHLFTAQYPDLRYIAAWNRWHHWTGRRWEADHTMNVFHRARSLCETESRMTGEVLKRVESAATAAAVVRMAGSDPVHAATIEQWDLDPWLLNSATTSTELKRCPTNGELKIVVREQRMEDYCTKSTAVDPDWNCPIPLWLAHLERVTAGDKKLQAFLQRVAGCCSTGDTSEECFFFLFGPGGNGKGVFVHTIKGVLGDYAVNTSAETFLESRNERHPADLARLKGARLITAGEPEEGRRWNEGLLQAFTGGDPITARHMRCDPFDFVPQGKLMFSSNHRPGLKSVNEAMRRRVQCIPFSVIIPKNERDPEFEAKLRPEWPGILAWMLDGCLMWQRERLNPPQAVCDASEEYLAAEDTLGRFIEEQCETSPNYSEMSSNLWERWKPWTEKVREFPGTQKEFAAKLESRFRGKKTKIGKVFYGLKLRDLNRSGDGW